MHTSQAQPLPPAVFSWTTGENTNVGDSLLRRPYLRTQGQIGPLNVWIRRSTPDFLAGLQVESTSQLTRSFVRWYAQLLASAARRRTLLIMNAGEFRVRPSGALLLIPLVVAATIVRFRGGSSLWLGVSVPQSSRRVLRRWYRLAFDRFDYVQWREPGTLASIGVRPVGPDWAFSELGDNPQLGTSTQRTEIAFVLRGDRPVPSEAWMEWARRLSSRLGLKPTVVVQVRQDQDRASEIARSLGAEILDWPSSYSHAEQEGRLRALYSKCAVVVGDRLHGLVIAATEGALPLGWVESSGGKIRRHFEAIGLSGPGLFEGKPTSELPELSQEDVNREQHATRAAVGDAKKAIDWLSELVSQLRHDSRPAALSYLRRPRRGARSRATRNASE